MENLNFNIFNILIFAGIFQGIIFSLIILLHEKYKSKTNKYIAFTVLALSLSNLQYWIKDVNFNGVLSIFDRFHIPFDTLITPMFFLFVCNYLRSKYSKKLNFILLIPFIISFLYGIIYFKEVFFAKNIFRVINATLEVTSLLFNLCLLVAIIMKIKSYEKNNKEYTKATIVAKTKWLKQILYIGGFLCFFWVIEIMYVQSKNNEGMNKYYPLWLSISFLVYWISYVGIFNTKILNERKNIRDFISRKSIEKDKNINQPKKSNSKLFSDIILWINESRIYLNPDLNTTLVANKFNISNGYISQLFSLNSEMNFNEYINNLRIEEAKKLLNNKNYYNYTILAIGLESGFNSKSGFYESFKKFTKKTPSEYKKLVQNN